MKNANPIGLITDFLRDSKLALRAMRKAPVFALFAVLTLAVGIAMSTAVFTIVNTLLLNPLPAPDPSRLVAVYTTQEQSGRKAEALLASSYRNLQDAAANQKVFANLGGFTPPLVMTYQAEGGRQRMFGELVTAGFFEALGIHPAKGRFFLPAEDSTPGSANVAVLSYGAWQSTFGGAIDILGRILHINGVSFTVVGVAPAGFIGVSAVFGPDVYLPATMAREVLPAQWQDALTARDRAIFHAVARLKPGVGRRQAQAEMTTLAADLARAYPQANRQRSFAVQPVSDELFSSAGGERTFQFAGAGLLVLVGVILVVACSNVANLLLARMSSRRHELSVRLAVGAGSGRIVRQFLAESVLLSLIAGVAGLALGFEACRLLWTLRPAEVAANLVSPRIDWTVFAFALAVSVFTGLLFGVAPALRASRTDVLEGLKEESRIAGASRRRVSFGNVLLGGQVALSLAALVTAALFLRGIQRAYRIDPGFDSRHLATFMMNPEQAGYDRARIAAFYRDLRDSVARLPGVADASWATNMPFWAGKSRAVAVEGRETRDQSEVPLTVVNTVDIGYFSTMRIPLLDGRGFTENDTADSLPVVIVNQYLAQKYWPGTSPIGRRIVLSGDTVMRRIVGVARTSNYSGLGETPQMCVYLPLRQNFVEGAVLYVRAAADPGGLLTVVERQIHAAAPEVAVSDVRTGQKTVSQVLFFQSIGVGILGFFGLLALALASVGLYGLQAYSVSRRHREIGVRLAMGADRVMVFRMVLRQGMTVVGIGLAAGLLLSLLAGRALSGMLFGLRWYDPVSLAAGTLALALAAVLACYLPARIASRVDPLAALRSA